MVSFGEIGSNNLKKNTMSYIYNYIERAEFKFNAEPLCNQYLHISLLNGPWHEFIYFFESITVGTNVLLKPNDLNMEIIFAVHSCT